MTPAGTFRRATTGAARRRRPHERFAAEPLIAAVGGDADRAPALLGLAHGLVDLGLGGHFATGTDIDAIWRSGVHCLVAAPSPAQSPPTHDQECTDHRVTWPNPAESR